MPVEKSAGAVVFHRGSDGKIEYLLLQNSSSKTWGFPKGLIDKGEKLEDAALREIEEEAGIGDLVLIGGFKETTRYFMKAKYDYQIEQGIKPGQTILKFVTYFLAESATKDAALSFEHQAYEWLGFSGAMERLKENKSSQGVLGKADRFLL